MLLKWKKFKTTWAAEGNKNNIRTFYLIADYPSEFLVMNPLQGWERYFSTLQESKEFCENMENGAVNE